MRIDLSVPGAWESICDQYRAALPFQDAAVVVQTCLGYQHALWEATQGLAQLFSHKKTVAIFQGVEPAFEDIAKNMSEDEFKVKRFTLADFADPKKHPEKNLATVKEWLEPIIADALFVLVAEDHPITARLYDTSALDAVLKDKRVFKISLSHAAFRQSGIARPGLYDVRVLSTAPERAVIVAGERFRVQPQLAGKLPYALGVQLEGIAANTAPAIANELQTFTDSQERLLKITRFEGSLAKGLKAYFQPGEARVADRAVFYGDDIDGSAVAEMLAEELAQTLGAPGADAAFEATSTNRWKSMRLATSLVASGEPPERVRGLVLIDVKAIDSLLAARLEKIVRRIHELQNG